MPDTLQKQFELKEFLPYLIARVGSLMELTFEPELKKIGLTMDMWRVLMVLHFNGSLSLVDLSRITGIGTSTLSRLVGRMVDRGLLSRRRSKEDTRAVDVRLRRAGTAIFHELWPLASTIERETSSLFPDTDMVKLKEMLREIEAVLLRRIG